MEINKYLGWRTNHARNIWMRWEDPKDITLSELELGDPVWVISITEATKVIQSEGKFVPPVNHRKIAVVTSVQLEEPNVFEEPSYHKATVVYESGKVRRIDTRLLYALRKDSPEYALWLVTKSQEAE